MNIIERDEDSAMDEQKSRSLRSIHNFSHFMSEAAIMFMMKGIAKQK